MGEREARRKLYTSERAIRTSSVVRNVDPLFLSKYHQIVPTRERDILTLITTFYK